jgi:probable F420-dependent oxidoreductase
MERTLLAHRLRRAGSDTGLAQPACHHAGVDSVPIGRVGIWTGQLDAVPSARARNVARELEAMGWPCLWRPESHGRDALVSAAQLLDATERLCVATGIAQIHARHPHTTKAAQRTLHEASGGRFLLGIGVSHERFIVGSRKLEYRTPYSDMVAYLQAMAEAPFTAVAADDEPPTVLAALGPKMLRLAATAAQGAHPYFSPVEHTAFARRTIGPDGLLAPEQMVVIDTDRQRAHQLAAHHMRRYLQLPNYTNNLRRLGFTEDDLAGPSERLIDAIVVCGSVDDVVARIAEQHDAGADHVCIQVLTERPTDLPLLHWSALATALGL